MEQALLGRSGLRVPRMGLGAMVWGQPTGRGRWTPAQLAYGRAVIIAAKYPPKIRSRPTDFAERLAGSLDRLQRDRIDLLQHHFPSKRMLISELPSWPISPTPLKPGRSALWASATTRRSKCASPMPSEATRAWRE